MVGTGALWVLLERQSAGGSLLHHDPGRPGSRGDQD